MKWEEKHKNIKKNSTHVHLLNQIKDKNTSVL